MTTSDRNPLALREALRLRKTSIANRAFLESLCDWDDIADCVVRDDHVKINRKSGGPSIKVFHGYTNGFRSKEEIIELFGDVFTWPSKRFIGAWGIDHPENQSRDSKGNSTKQQNTRDQQLCPTCFMYMSLSGICASCN